MTVNVYLRSVGTVLYYDGGVRPGTFVGVKDVTGNAATNNIVITAGGAALIDGEAIKTINLAYGWMVLKSTDTGWAVVGSGSAGGGVDTTAIHKATAGEIAAMTAKAVPTSSDLLVIEDAAASNAKKKITLGSLPSSGTIIAGKGWQVDTDGTLDDFLVEFWNMRGPGATGTANDGFFDPGVIGNWPLAFNGASFARWGLKHPRGGRRGSVDIAASLTNYPRSTGVTADFCPCGTKPFWWSIWFYPRTTTHDMLVAKASGATDRHWRISAFSDSKCYIVSSADGITEGDSVGSSGTYTTNAWNHVLAGWANGKLFIALNGETLQTSSVASIFAASTIPVTFGTYQVSTGLELDGHLADIGYWCDYAGSPTMVEPTATQIASLYNSGNGNAFLGFD